MRGSSSLSPAEALAATRDRALSACGSAWEGLASVVDTVLADPLDPPALLPYLCAIGCGGDPLAGVEVATAVLLDSVALRILDDVADQDNPLGLDRRMGAGPAVNTAVAAGEVAVLLLSQLDTAPGRREALLRAHSAAKLAVLRGQDSGASGSTTDLASYEAVVRDKTVAAFGFAARAGALAATVDEVALDQCLRAGEHYGWMTQVLDDIEELWFPDGDLDRCPAGYPMFWDGGRRRPDEPRLELCARLDLAGVREALMGMALDHRDAVLASLGDPFDPDARETLAAVLDWVFQDGQSMVAAPAYS